MGRLIEEFKGLVERVREHDEELANELSQFGDTGLMRKADQSAELEAEIEAGQSKVQRLERGRELHAALADYGLDFGALRPAERSAIAAYEGELDRDAIAEFVAQNDLPVRR